MKQFCPYLLCYLAGAAQINYAHLHRSIHYSSCKHISQMKCQSAPGVLISTVALAAARRLSQRAASSVLKKPAATRGASPPAASSARRSLPGSLNVEDLSVSISQLISAGLLASAAHSFYRAVYLLPPSCPGYAELAASR